MAKTLTVFLKELREHCKRLRQNQFEISVEIWSGFGWMPWTVYVDGQSMNFSVQALSSQDLEELLDQGIIEVVKEYTPEELDNELEISRIRYKLFPY